MIQFTENLPAINDINHNNNNNNNNIYNNYFNTNQTINESIEHILPENDDKIASWAKKNNKEKENLPFIADFRMTKSKSLINFYRKSSLNSTPILQKSKLKRKKIGFLLNSLNSNNNNNINNTNINSNKSSTIINSSSSGKNENSSNSLSRSIMRIKGMRKKSSKVRFTSAVDEMNSTTKILLNTNTMQNKKNVKIK